MKTLLSRRVVIAVFLLFLALFLVRPGAGRLRGKLSQSISQALGRRVEIGSVHLRFLPRPGFEFENLVVHDDAAFGAEPLLRASDVTASLRVLPFLRGRVEIASLSLDEASVNLTRDPQGKWNLEDLLERTARNSTAPTAAEKMESRPAFPYIEAAKARINFKIGAEKTHFAFTDARFALWQESENAWGMRLKAQPIRTDANLTDTGVLNLSGMWQRSPVLRETPVQFSFEWKQAQIGQASKLIYGNDKGWRGNLVLAGALVGTPGKLRLSADASIDDFRRNDVLGGGTLQLVAHCAAEYSSLQKMLSNVDCNAPAGDGSLELKGSASGLPFSSYDFVLVSTKVPAQAALSLLRQSRSGIPDDFDASGSLNANLQLSRGDHAQQPHLRGDGNAQDLRINSRSLGSEIALGVVPFSFAPWATDGKLARLGVAPRDPSVNNARLEMGPVNIVLGRPSPLRARASFSLYGYQAAIANANLVLDENVVRVQNLNASAAQTTWRGSLQVARPCVAPGACKVQFNLRTAELNAADLNDLLNPSEKNQSWYKFLSRSNNQPPYLLHASAIGKIAVDKLVLGKSACTQLTADFDLHDGKLKIANLKGQTLTGKATGEWQADFSSRPPVYSGSGSFDGVSMAGVADLMHNAWIDGSGAAKYEFKASGWGLQDLLDSVDLTGDFVVRDGSFPRISLTSNSSVLRTSHFSGKILLREGEFSFPDAKLESPNGVYKVSGTVSLTGGLNLKMTGESVPGFALSGTLLKTRISAIPITAAQASLKP